MMVAAVVTTLTSIMPAPTARPMTAVMKMQAAVVSPEMPSSFLRMSPAPMKPMPVSTWAAIRPGSPFMRLRLFWQI